MSGRYWVSSFGIEIQWEGPNTGVGIPEAMIHTDMEETLDIATETANHTSSQK